MIHGFCTLTSFVRAALGRGVQKIERMTVYCSADTGQSGQATMGDNQGNWLVSSKYKYKKVERIVKSVSLIGLRGQRNAQSATLREYR
jgi:hypothetical protein